VKDDSEEEETSYMVKNEVLHVSKSLPGSVCEPLNHETCTASCDITHTSDEG
jgi:hypothetical protein